MNAKDAFRQSYETSDMVVRAYLDDLGDADLLVRSVPGANHIAWQLGHLITSTHHMLAGLGQAVPALPDGFTEAHGKEAAGRDDPARFSTKAQYLALMDQVKAAVTAAIETTREAKLDDPGPEAMRDYAPTVGAVLLLLGNHWMMHAGQFVPIRRKLGRPPLF
jgi:uncharacterized damage-inducible protein DinB